eukprot:CAMPEP_0196595526 /NCGR_PEP_ID=MMETSP1081-20130531/81336_1 /TAXON_ID=36882 /ORGANISM="Pyramimonas amylifera, Strain CCMP720" /LENGTH=280 /DNA_ID=CAMNT_0041920133 /DNA_START=167 /DNA_END=1009 /DNA_ORIENTATION=+
MTVDEVWASIAEQRNLAAGYSIKKQMGSRRLSKKWSGGKKSSLERGVSHLKNMDDIPEWMSQPGGKGPMRLTSDFGSFSMLNRLIDTNEHESALAKSGSKIEVTVSFEVIPPDEKLEKMSSKIEIMELPLGPEEKRKTEQVGWLDTPASKSFKSISENLEISATEKSLSSEEKAMRAAEARRARFEKRKRKDVEVVDVECSRNLERKMKNRESAARSRNRQQKYTDDLEQEVAALTAENRALKEKVELKQKYPEIYNGAMTRLRRFNSTPNKKIARLVSL